MKKLALVLLSFLLLTGAAGASTTSKPRVTSQPTIRQDGAQLIAGNGGWLVESGTVSEYLFRFVCDGQLRKGVQAFPATTNPGVALPGQYPEDPQANYLPVTGADTGRSCYVDVAGGTISDYTFAGGSKVLEWGNPARSSVVVVQQADPPPTSPLPCPAAGACVPQAAAARAVLQAQILSFRAHGDTWAQIKLERTYTAWRLLGGR